MNKHFAAAAKSAGIPVVYYVAPQAWASREGRVKKLAEVADVVACILPFEEAWFQQRGVNAKFVGHPLFDERHGLPGELPAPAVRPWQQTALAFGSRPSVAKKNAPRMIAVAQGLVDAHPSLRFVAPLTEDTAFEASRAGIMTLEGRLKTVRDDFDRGVNGCDAALTVSGTATLHTAALGVPMVAVYAGNPLLWHGIGRWLIKTRTFTLVNLLHDGEEHLIPEFIPWYGSIQPAADALRRLLENPAARERQRAGFAKIVDQLRGTDAARTVADLVTDFC